MKLKQMELSNRLVGYSMAVVGTLFLAISPNMLEATQAEEIDLTKQVEETYLTKKLQGIDLFLGEWSVNIERTLEEVKKSPKYNPEDAANMSEMLKKVISMMRIEVKDRELISSRGNRRTVLPYTLKSSGDDTVTLSVLASGKEVEIKLSLIDGKYMNLKSSATDDMDYYIWERSQ